MMWYKIILSALFVLFSSCYPIENSLTQPPEPGQCNVTIGHREYSGTAQYEIVQLLSSSYSVIVLEPDSNQSIKIIQSQFQSEKVSQNRDDIPGFELQAVYENKIAGILSHSLSGTLEIFEMFPESIRGAFDFEMGGNAYASLPSTPEDYFSIYGEFNAFPE